MICHDKSGYIMLGEVRSGYVWFVMVRTVYVSFVLVTSGYFRLDQERELISGYARLGQVMSR